MKIGILGGSFNPVHVGHVRMAIETLERLGLDRVELMPAKEPPHKPSEGILPFDLRMDLVNAAVDDVPGLGANPLEGERPGPSFTCDTLTCYADEQPKDELHFIVGASTFLEMHTWRRGLEVPALASLAVVNRWQAGEAVADYIAETWPKAEREDDRWTLPGGKVIRLLDAPRLDIKGEEIRRRWLERSSLRFLVPPGVESLLENRADEVELHWGRRTKEQ